MKYLNLQRKEAVSEPKRRKSCSWGFAPEVPVVGVQRWLVVTLKVSIKVWSAFVSSGKCCDFPLLLGTINQGPGCCVNER